ncbi:MAG TPA: phosphoglucomutase/phosphomannomutase family protein [bacterium]|nr:phosphoglucomutase/phosphomannomutase family protein [bacterium]
MPTITFGTSGWRAFIADDFTYPNVRIAAQAIAAHLAAGGHAKKGVIVSYDPRFLGPRFAEAAAEVLAGNGIASFITVRDTPTPVVAFEQLRRGLDGAINFTASHNPPEYGGLKFNPHWGGPATKDITHDIEERAEALEKGGAGGVKRMPLKDAEAKGLVHRIDPMPAYLKKIESMVDLKAIKKAKLKVVVDSLHGAGRGYVETVLAKAGAKVTALHGEADPMFGGGAPDPAEGHIDALVKAVKSRKADLGTATDGDADRFGIVDNDGSFIPPNLVIALLVHHLHRTRKSWKGAVVRSVVSSHFIDAVAKLHGREVVETPVGFKWIGEYMQTHDILIGGEESGGLTVHRHLPEKDGPLACLLMAEMRAVEGRPFRKILKDLYKKTGLFVVGRGAYRLSEERKQALAAELAKGAPESVAGSKVEKHVTLDGHKFVLADGAWLAIRFSGTEPVVRLYLEANSEKRLEQLRAAGAKLIEG